MKNPTSGHVARSEHTPGPWVDRGDINGGAIESPCGRYVIAVVNYGLGYGEENARLIAAAPELLAALQDLRTFDRVLFKHPGTAKNGVEHRQCRFCDAMWELGTPEQHVGNCISIVARAAIQKATGGA